MGVIKYLVSDPAKAGERPTPTSEKLATPANFMTASRPILAAYAGSLLVRGKKGALKPTIIAAATDMEGNVARLMDKFAPKLERGSTKNGAKADTYADASALIILGGSILRAPRISEAGKFAAEMVLLQEAQKAAWAYSANREFKEVTGSKENLYIPPTREGKEAMAEKLITICMVVATNETDNMLYTTALDTAALGLAQVSTNRGSRAMETYKNDFDNMIASASIQDAFTAAEHLVLTA